MLSVFYKSNSSRLNAFKVIKIVLIILFAFMIAVLPAVKTYASSVLVGALVAGLLGTAVGAALGAAGCTAVVAILAGMCVSIGVSALYALFDDEDFQTAFLQEWDALIQQFEYRVVGATVICSGAGFKALYNLVKTKIVDHFATTVTPELNGNLPLFNPVEVPVQPYMEKYGDWLNGNSNLYRLSYDRNNTNMGSETIINSITNFESTLTVSNVNTQIWIFYEDSNYHLKIKAFQGDGYFIGRQNYINVQPFVIADNNALQFAQGFAFWQGFNATNTSMSLSLNEVYFTDNNTASVTDNDKRLYLDDQRVYYLDNNNVKHYYKVKDIDGVTTEYFGSYKMNSFLYYILCTECTLIDSVDNSTVVDSVGTVSSTVNNYYSESKDIYNTYYNQIASAEAAGTLATGTNEDVKISTASLSNSLVGTETLADTTVVTDVQSAVETTTGDTITLSPSIMCMNGINLIRVTSGGIRDKFPFAVVYVLRDSFNVLAATRETPVFTIPLRFNIAQLVSIDEDFTIDLSDLNTIAAIARWGELGALGIALAILTKRMLF